MSVYNLVKQTVKKQSILDMIKHGNKVEQTLADHALLADFNNRMTSAQEYGGLGGDTYTDATDMVSRADRAAQAAITAQKIAQQMAQREIENGNVPEHKRTWLEAFIGGQLMKGYKANEKLAEKTTAVTDAVNSEEYGKVKTGLDAFAAGATSSMTMGALDKFKTTQGETLGDVQAKAPGAAMAGSIAGGIISTMGTGALVGAGAKAAGLTGTVAKLATAAGTGAVTSGLPAIFAGKSAKDVLIDSSIGTVSWLMGSAADTVVRSALLKAVGSEAASKILGTLGSKILSNPIVRELLASTGGFNLTQIGIQEGANAVIHGKSDYFKDPMNIIRDTIINTIFDTVQGAKFARENARVKTAVDAMVRNGVESDYKGAADNIREVASVVSESDPALAREMWAQAEVLETKNTISPEEAAKTEYERSNNNGEVQAQAPQEVKAESVPVESVMQNPAKTTQEKASVTRLKNQLSKLPRAEVEAKVAELEAKAQTETGPALLKVNLQLFAAKEALKLIPIGEAPRARDSQIPVETEAGKTRQGARTLYEAAVTDERAAQNILTDVYNGEFAYEPITDKSAIEPARAEVASNAEAVRNELTAILDHDSPVKNVEGKMLLAKAEALYEHYVKTGDYQRARETASQIAEMATIAGQTLQGMRIIKKMTAVGYLTHVQRLVDKLNIDGKRKMGKKWEEIKLTDSEMEALKNLPDGESEARDNLTHQIELRIANDVKTTVWDKLNSWRMFAMLANPKTHIRNIASNALQVPLTFMSDAIATGLEKVFLRGDKTGNRTKAIRIDKPHRDAATAYWEVNKKDIHEAGRGEKWDANMIGTERVKAFKKLEFLNWMMEKNADLLEWEDRLSIKRSFINHFAEIKEARGGKISDADAADYALRRAKEMTFRDANALAKAMTKVSKQGGIAGWAMDTVMPFKRTPLNVVKRGIEYSPLAVAKMFYDSKKTGKYAGGEGKALLIEDISKSATGSVLMGLGLLLAKLGIVSSNPSDDQAKLDYEKSVGKQPFAIKYKGNYYTFDWAQPAVIPLVMGVSIYNALADKNSTALESIVDAIGAGNDSVFNLPFMTGVQNVAKAITYKDKTKVGEQLMAAFQSMAVNYAQQFIPTVGGQVARSIDPTIRTTMTPSSVEGEDWAKNLTPEQITALNIVLPKTLRQYGRYILSRTPFANQLLQPKVDIWGREVSGGGAGERIAENLVSPGIYSQETDTKITEGLDALFNELDDSKRSRIFPNLAPTSLSYNGKTYQITPTEYTAWQKAMGQRAYENYSTLFDSPYFDNLPADIASSKIPSIDPNTGRQKVDGNGNLIWTTNTAPSKYSAIANAQEDAYEYAKMLFLKTKGIAYKYNRTNLIGG